MSQQARRYPEQHESNYLSGMSYSIENIQEQQRDAAQEKSLCDNCEAPITPGTTSGLCRRCFRQSQETGEY